jgi:hypothetical protein
MSIFSGKKLSVFLHIAGWTIILLLPIYLTTVERRHDMFFIGRVIIRTLIYIVLFYISYFWLIPRLLFKDKRLQYYFTVIAFIIGLYFVNEILNRAITRDIPKPEVAANRREPRDHKEKRFNIFWKFDVYNYLLTSILISGFSVGLRMSGKYNENEKKRKELEKEKLTSELAFLKNQVSPHFFFNTLNNIYSLTEINTKEAQNAILQLSKLMRYLLYESEKGDISLNSEIAFMKNYIDLMKLRLSDKVSLTTSFPVDEPNISIPPLIFIPFIENAFKHGVSYRDKSFIKIELKVFDRKILFTSQNSIAPKQEDMLDSGIGLENVRKRLALLFPGMHKLQIDTKDNIFEVSLEIEANA